MTDIAELVRRLDANQLSSRDRGDAARTLERQAKALADLTAKHEARGQQYLGREVEMARLRAEVKAQAKEIAELDVLRQEGRRAGLEEAAQMLVAQRRDLLASMVRDLAQSPPKPASECTCYDCACRVCKRHNAEFCPVHGQPKPPPHAPDDAPTGATLLPGARRAVVRRR